MPTSEEMVISQCAPQPTTPQIHSVCAVRKEESNLSEGTRNPDDKIKVYLKGRTLTNNKQ